MQFTEPTSKVGKCVICGAEIVSRTTRGKKNLYCSRVCSSQSRFATRYRGTMSGPAERPTKLSRTKLEIL